MSDIQVFEDEELLQETSTRGIGDINWTSKTNLALGVITCGAWYIVPVVLAVLGQKEYVITDERIVESSGFISSDTRQFNFENIVGDITTSQSATQAATGVGNVSFEIQKTRKTSGTTGNIGERERNEDRMNYERETVTLEDIQNHEEVAHSIREMRRD